MRDLSIDFIRGLCIISMVIGHLAMGSVLWKISHMPLWIDGAFGFVFLSGLILGMVHRKKAQRAGRPDYMALFRRAWLLYVVQFAILTLASIVQGYADRANLPDPQVFGGWVNSIVLTASLQLPADNLTILPLYVVLLLASSGVLSLFVQKKYGLALALSAAIYLFSLFFPVYTVMPFLHQDPGSEFNWAAWQFPFVGALFIGWHWQDRKIRDKVLSTPVVGSAFALWVTIFLLAHIARLGALDGSSAKTVLDFLFAKWDIGPGAIVYGLCGLILLYWIANQIASFSWLGQPVGVVSTIGQRSLDSFIVLCLAFIFLTAVFNYNQASATGMAFAILVLVICWMWASLRNARSRRTFDRLFYSMSKPSGP